ncbi:MULTISPECIES: hypothetical protein [Virgibacillus]|uniref:DUF2642 domain-containing protein n=2 Tax=Virgibacillus TaxID=84406 RepID=A0A024QF44_9BACI|nr:MULTISPECIES: hypothetical protein [Virgibacillus]EQB38984.1 hypothetical protein M948_01150 [Virgibacillus sp. CM-4]MYL43347.1 hypothetical protein [Virgibacillus massiliensis]GGJ67964.1 hypothetical protein GCM10007111_32270 [Virgibacillus kapii]CDQ41109.1 hypothetical protein BN990_03462 [Virgibacillus massiliensis]
MFEDAFAAELATQLGSTVEVATDNNLIEGILSTVTAELVLVIDVSSGYGDNVKIYISLDAINFVRFPVAA